MAGPSKTPPASLAPSSNAAAIRACKRYACAVDCAVDIDGLGRAQLHCENVSAHGAFFGAAVLLDEGTRVRCAIPLPRGGLWLVAGKVVRADEGAAPGMAVAFEGVTAFDRRRLDAAFSQVLLGGKPAGDHEGDAAHDPLQTDLNRTDRRA